ncbi:MAG: hypothetical protein QXU11_00145 [Thermoproteota archaeon]
MCGKFEVGLWAYMDFREKPYGQEDVERFVNWCNKVGIQKVLMSVRTGLFANFPGSKMLPPLPKFRSWNALGEIVKMLHDAGKEIHAMIIVAPWLELGGMSSDRNAELVPRPSVLDNPEWLCTDRYGLREDKAPFFGTRINLDIGKPEVREYIAEHVEDVLTINPELDGIHLDFIRYRYWKSSITMEIKDGADFGRLFNEGDIVNITKKTPGPAGHVAVELAYYLKFSDRTKYAPYDGTRAILEREYAYCFCNSCLKRFQEETEVEIPRQLRRTKEKADWIFSNEPLKWYTWRAEQVKKQVELIRRTTRRLSTRYKLSAATFARFPPHGIVTNDKPPSPEDYESVIKAIGQDWILWANEGLLDFAEPMLYWTKPNDFESIIRHLMSRMESKRFPIYPGILVSNEYIIEPNEVAEYAKRSINASGSGITLFQYASWCAAHRKAFGLPEIRDYDQELIKLTKELE